MKVGDKVVVRDGAWAWMQSYGWTAATKSFTIDGKSGVLISIGRHFCEVKLEGVVNIVDVPSDFISPIGCSAENANEDSACSKTDDKRVLLRAVDHYGAKNQAAQLMGEMGELAAELTRHFFQDRDRAKELPEEIADVQIMLDQMILHLGIQEEVAVSMLNKLKRLENRIKAADAMDAKFAAKVDSEERSQPAAASIDKN
jgi:NTP pyrophosphatase (non-canonical NTP hydrolase)